MNEAKSADLIIGDAMYLCSFLIADKFSLPHVTILMSSMSAATTFLPYNFVELPSYIPQISSRMTDDMNFLQRAKNTLLWLLHRTTFPLQLHQVYAGLKKKHNITPEKTLDDTFQRVDIIIVQSDPLDYPRPHLPSEKNFFACTETIISKVVSPVLFCLKQVQGEEGGGCLIKIGKAMGMKLKTLMVS